MDTVDEPADDLRVNERTILAILQQDLLIDEEKVRTIPLPTLQFTRVFSRKSIR